MSRKKSNSKLTERHAQVENKKSGLKKFTRKNIQILCTASIKDVRNPYICTDTAYTVQ